MIRARAPSPQESFVINSLILQTAASQDHVTIPSDTSANQEAVELSVTAPLEWSIFYAFTALWTHNLNELLVCPFVTDAGRFQQLVEQWRAERGATSSFTDMVLCSAYQKIIGMGERAIPLIIRQLELEADDPDHWGWALYAITGEDPVPPEAAGDTVQIAQAWLAWGRAQHAG
jgi:hypothetical protein